VSVASALKGLFARPYATVSAAEAAAMLARDGREVSNLTGGMHAWARAGLPVVAKGGGPGRIA
jgi:3-mercaptopyruvate sulfurtransferase SseA